MAQNVVDFSGNPTGEQLMDDYLDKDQQNVLTSNSGIQRPSYAVAGTKWLDTSVTPWLWKMYDGTNDVTLGTVNPSTHTFIPYGVDSKQDIANLSQTLDDSTTKYPSNNAVQDAVNSKVGLTGNETIYGYKTFRNDNSAAKVFIQGNLGLSENPAISGGHAQLEFHDKNGEWEGIVGVERYTNGQRLLRIQLKDQDGAQNRIELVRDQNGVWYATCPTPPTTNNDKAIATTAWVRQVAALKDLSNITKPYVTETYQNGASWYRVWSDGWCEQGGQCVISQAAWVTITFLKSFINTNYVATGGSKVSDSSYPNNPLSTSFRNYTTTSVQSAVHDDETINKGTWTWRVCGYIS